MTSSLGS